jgi:catalase
VLLASAIGAPESYVMATYAAVHTFIVTAPAPDSNPASEGVRRWVRFAWEPVDGVLKKRPRDWPHHDPAEPPEVDYLNQRLKDRIERGPARFELIMTIGEVGDDFNDPTRPWPPHRVRVIMGKLILDKVPDEQEQDERIEKMNFNPLHLTEGIAPSDDPVLALRGISYWYSSNQRGGLTCPFSRM